MVLILTPNLVPAKSVVRALLLPTPPSSWWGLSGQLQDTILGLTLPLLPGFKAPILFPPCPSCFPSLTRDGWSGEVGEGSSLNVCLCSAGVSQVGSWLSGSLATLTSPPASTSFHKLPQASAVSALCEDGCVPADLSPLHQ